jgi:hypothetical protein
MKKLLCVLALMLAATANAAVLNFENVNLGNSTYERMSTLGATNYGGFVLDWYLGSKSESSYANVAHSGRQYISNGSNVNDLTISKATNFTFNGAWFAAPTHSNPAEWVNITAYGAGNVLIGSTGNVAISTTSQFIAANFANVRSLTITRADGWFAMDDFTYADAVVPEPASIALFGLALVGFAAARRRKQQ